MGVICGVTTNPSLIAKEGRVFEEVIAEIASIVDGPISGEVKATTVDAEGMIAKRKSHCKNSSEHGCENPYDSGGTQNFVKYCPQKELRQM